MQVEVDLAEKWKRVGLKSRVRLFVKDKIRPHP